VTVVDRELLRDTDVDRDSVTDSESEGDALSLADSESDTEGVTDMEKLPLLDAEDVRDTVCVCERVPVTVTL